MPASRRRPPSSSSSSSLPAANVAAAAPARKQRRRKPRGQPKRALCAYMIFQSQARAAILAEAGVASRNIGAAGKVLGAAWAALSSETRKKWEALAQQDRERHAREMAQWKKDNPRIKRAATAYAFFVKETRPKIVRNNPEFQFEDIGRELGAQWRRLSVAAKSRFLAMSTADKARFDAASISASGSTAAALAAARSSKTRKRPRTSSSSAALSAKKSGSAARGKHAKSTKSNRKKAGRT